jgi:hypothetical protein
MTSRRSIHWLLMLAIAVAAQTASGSTAQASCGDYLIGHGPRDLMPAHEVASGLPSQLPSVPLRKLPCHGPGCQKAPAQPMAPAPVQLPQSETQQLGCLVAKLTLTTAKPTLSHADHLEHPRAGEPTSIEHPPRA